VEVVESSAPILVNRLELVRDSGGAGKHRGGLGLLIEVEVLNKAGVTLLDIGGHDKYPAQGLFGGLPGSKTKTLLRRSNSKDFVVINPRKIIQLNNGDIARFYLAGGGGYGNPCERDPRKVLEDVRNGYVSRRAARKVYRVAIEDGSSLNINKSETQKLRDNCRGINS
jgi:N-methylhydantoinase B